MIATETFKPLVLAQAKARKVEPRLIIVKHPIGGLNADVAANDCGTLAREDQCSRATNASAGASDEADLPREPACHHSAQVAQAV